MGVNSSVLTDDDLQRLKGETDIKLKDIKKCHKKFSSLDKEKKGFVSITDLVNIPEIENNPLRYHIAQYMSNNNENEAISFEAFIKVIDIFKNNKTDKQYKFMYDLFDFDKVRLHGQQRGLRQCEGRGARHRQPDLLRQHGPEPEHLPGQEQL